MWQRSLPLHSSARGVHTPSDCRVLKRVRRCVFEAGTSHSSGKTLLDVADALALFMQDKAEFSSPSASAN